MKRIEFKLGMPGVNSWDGRWSGEGRNFTVVKTMTDRGAAKLMGTETRATWFHRWDDGWCASITARVVPKGERLAKSDGFMGYGWMVRNIIDHGDPKEETRRPCEVAP